MAQERDNRAGDATRKRLMDEGLRLFATVGYNAVSTREIAQAAGVNHAAIGSTSRASRAFTQPSSKTWWRSCTASAIRW